MNPEASTPLRGHVVQLFAFDVAYEIATERVGQLMARTPTRFVVCADRAAPKAVPLYRPLEIELDLTVGVGGQPASVLIRLYDIGVVTVALRVPLALADLNAARPFHNLTLDSGVPAETWAAGVCADICRELAPVLTRSVPPTEPEAYTVFCLTDLGSSADTTTWLAEHSRTVAGLLCDEPADRLSAAQVEETLSLRRSYERDDLVVISWDAALVVDRHGRMDDELYVLELANLQLVEFRVLDQLLDRQLNAAYADLERRHAPLWGRVPGVLRSLRRHRVELTQLADQVTHITKFIGDWYLARVYLAAHERFALERWRASVAARLAQLNDLYAVVQTEAHEQRMLLLELAVVLLFVIDIAALLLWK